MRKVKEISAFDIIGPIMIGPSSSHTAGAVFLGKVARAVLGQMPTKVEINLHGSFAKTAKGHGTDKALIAGLLNLSAHDERIKSSFDLAKEEGLDYQFNSVDLGDVHPNSVQFLLWGEDKEAQVVGASVGGGAIKVNRVQGRKVNFNGDHATLLIFGRNQSGTTNDVTGAFVENKINIAYLRVERLRRQKEVVMVFETDEPIPLRGIKAIRALPWVEWVCQIDKIER
ncbi:MAG: L-serine ammonia-lyase, iron-sulfur-dependent, subunit beta [Anaerolineae bacterium]|jgi:L-serine dehydratase|nr:L-serine ammonia-lyase, iron-sulfur-dependent, subunit beta [Anaerolineae bacterium]MBT4311964.1 L-serine ammonia-lyase, iron-sulfur-dependent, subunit beta [Anaerolineae bacterium]MBT4459364.1 L-serine ammonia-lyase, iron-sulfur-dependent, subunit beta [Anaerolineae bacterium]MBT4841266.1 L-serine ammonia-lyase, iron-sulfur-dependent, subunit beta [Anaerolineae bacterium]MBT6060558.1 L-serine ammonia-lyase, iron-sulfur-dependent, subunit beta [Anaerolineae bacterium]